MKEKINVRIAEVRLWGDLADSLESIENSTRSDANQLTEELKERYPDGGEEAKRSWQYDDLQKLQAKLKAIESVRAIILKAMG